MTMGNLKTLSIPEMSLLENLVTKGKHQELYNFLEKNEIKFNANPMTKEGYCLQQQGEELLNYVFDINEKEKAEKTNQVLKSFGALRYRGPHYTEPDLKMPIQVIQSPWN